MIAEHLAIIDWIIIAQHEILLFTAAFFAFGVLDELAVDFLYVGMRLKGLVRTQYIADDDCGSAPLGGKAAVFIPAWQEAMVIGHTVGHMLSAWPHTQLTIYVGCYHNDQETIASAMVAARDAARVRLVIHEAAGPTSKADCLNRLYAALVSDERRTGEAFRMIVLHDAEDMVDPAALAVLDLALWQADFVQLPVLALPQRGSPLIGSHYSDEFAEAHGKTLCVRDALGAAIPGAGVGCAIARMTLAQFGDEPFERHSLTEDYELGLRIAAAGGRGRFLRCRAADGRLIATRAFFPAELVLAVRQKTRWMHGIALQGWDRLGWSGKPADLWMQLRDRRGPLAALLLVLAYVLIVSAPLLWVLTAVGLARPYPIAPVLVWLLLLNAAGLVWRAGMRAAFTAREFGWRVALLSLPRVLVSNVVAIMAARRALGAYIGTLRGAPVVWDKTEHRDHPAVAERLAIDVAR